jgi:hypothetical protein
MSKEINFNLPKSGDTVRFMLAPETNDSIIWGYGQIGGIEDGRWRMEDRGWNRDSLCSILYSQLRWIMGK